MYIEAPLKVNLSLRVWQLLPNGYHKLVSHFHSIKLFEKLNIAFNEDGTITFIDKSGYSPSGRDNLLYKAFQFWKKIYPAFNNVGINVELEKIVPPGTGLGSGSSDAAAVLYALNYAFKVDENKILSQMKDLGADVPFAYLAVKKWQTQRRRIQCRVSGIGEQLDEIEPLAGEFVIFIPQSFSIATATAYQKIDELKDYSAEKEEFYPYGKNDFELVLDGLFKKELDSLKVYLKECGAKFTVLSGSGSAVVSYFEEKAPANLPISKKWKVLREKNANI
jgi:4-diphosphocytidyl-2-C-methyl-D-erythritol kinase